MEISDALACPRRAAEHLERDLRLERRVRCATRGRTHHRGDRGTVLRPGFDDAAEAVNRIDDETSRSGRFPPRSSPLRPVSGRSRGHRGAGPLRGPAPALAVSREVVAAWRERMGTDEAKQIYEQRAATAETVNADAKTHRGLDRLSVRGLGKVLGSATLFALTYDVLRLIALRG